MNTPAIDLNIPAAVAAWIASFGKLLPFAVNISEARTVLGGKSRSGVYEEIGRGNLEALKDGDRTLITTDSIIRYCSRMPAAKVQPPKPKKYPKRGRPAGYRAGVAR